MLELIDKQSALSVCKEYCWLDDEDFIEGYNTCIKDMREAIKELPTVEAEPVRHGLWIELPPALNPSERPHKCSACGHVLSFYGAYPKACYCPNCGAKMDALKTCCCISEEEAKRILGGAYNG